jgi:hypothetical protein
MSARGTLLFPSPSSGGDYALLDKVAARELSHARQASALMLIAALLVNAVVHHARAEDGVAGCYLFGLRICHEINAVDFLAKHRDVFFGVWEYVTVASFAPKINVKLPGPQKLKGTSNNDEFFFGSMAGAARR